MTKQNKNVKNSDAVPTLKSNVESGEQDWNPSDSAVKYVVVRDGFRVSDREYNTQNDPNAVAETSFWQKIVRQYPDGTKVGVVQYDKKKHRIW